MGIDCAGQQVVVATQTGRSIGGPIETFAPEWEAKTGGNVELQQFAFGELFEKIVTSFETGANDFDMIVFPADWAGDFMAPGYLEPIPQAILDSIDPEDIIPLYGDRITAWGDTIYALPYDGDAHMLYYRKDLVNPESPFAAEFQEKYGYPLDEPKTWQQYYDIAEFFNGREVETAGQTAPIYRRGRGAAPQRPELLGLPLPCRRLWQGAGQPLLLLQLRGHDAAGE